MGKTNTELEKARSAKRKALKLYGEMEIVNGIGISRQDGDYAIRINLMEEAAGPEQFKSKISGVPVVLKVVGRVKKQD